MGSEDNGVRVLFATIQAIRDSLESGDDGVDGWACDPDTDDVPCPNEDAPEDDEDAYEDDFMADGDDGCDAKPEPDKVAEPQPSQDSSPKSDMPRVTPKSRKRRILRSSSKKASRLASAKAHAEEVVSRLERQVSLASDPPETPRNKVLPRASTAESYEEPMTGGKEALLDELLQKLAKASLNATKLLSCVS